MTWNGFETNPRRRLCAFRKMNLRCEVSLTSVAVCEVVILGFLPGGLQDEGSDGFRMGNH
jgi:hypothetical protein